MPLIPTDPYHDFSTLSFRDLVDARDFYHRQLMRKQNVVGTALGRYLVRKERNKKDPKKTLFNTEVKKYSWPCILVFVKEWAVPGKFGSGHQQIDPAHFIPPSIEMADGRVVPTCVVEAQPEEATPPEPFQPTFPTNWIGGGYPVIADVQGQEHVASIGGMVSDGHLIYAITNRHVTGAAGETVYSVIGGEKVAIGRSSRKQITLLPFEKAYPGWPSKDMLVHMDIGLIQVDDATRWTAQIYGIGAAGHMLDLGTDSISMRIIDCPLRAYGCASGQLHGRVLGMFYRYKAVSGSEYVADFIIGPNGSKPFTTHHGDSGTLWLLDTGNTEMGLMPLAVQWGGQVVMSGPGPQQRQPYALATGLSTVCRVLSVDFVQDWNIGQAEYWGAVGHYTIAEKSCEIVQDASLKALMQANLASITFPLTEINKKNMQGLSTRPFVPLADVPDMVWKVGPNKRGGMTSPEHSNHFADMDKKDSNNNTLLQICEKSPTNIDPDVWLKYYNDPKVKDQSKGLLPFRCWQIYDEMVKAVRAGDAKRFVCAAGILSHYVGDACQPLHISYLFNGDPAVTETVEVKDSKTGQMKSVQQPVAHGVHSAYEDGLVNFHTPEIIAGLKKTLTGHNGLALNKQNGFGAAVAVVKLMQQTFATIQPKDIVKAYVPIKKLKPKEIADHLWTQFGQDTIQVMADGARTLAMLWESAWAEGGGTAKLANAGKNIKPSAFKSLYIQPGFLPSFTLAQIKPALSGKGAAKPARAARAKVKRASA